MSEFQATEGGPRVGTPYRFSRREMETQGRRRSFLRTAMVFVFLLILQYPLRQVAMGHWASVAQIPREVPARLSLLVDLGMIVAYVVLAHRSLELVQSLRPAGTRPRMLAATAFWAVVSGALLDVLEDGILWFDAGTDTPAHPDLTITWLTWLMRALVIGGLLLGVGATIWSRHPQATATEDDPRTTDEDERPGLVICCSGGGVRSASFCLGGLQALTKANQYQTASAVVGVSGGGYIAAAMHVLRWKSQQESQHGGQPKSDPWPTLDPEAFTPDSPEEKWLRRRTRYLFDSAQVAVFGMLSLLFGITVNLIILTALIGVTAWLSAWFLLASGGLKFWNDPAGIAKAGGYTGDWAWADRSWIILAAGTALFLGAKVFDRMRQSLGLKGRDVARSIILYLIVVGTAVIAVLHGLPLLLAWLNNYASDANGPYADLFQTLGFGTGPPTSSDSSGLGVSVTSLGALAATLLAAVRALGSTLTDNGKDKDKDSITGKWLAKIWAKIKGVILPWVAAIVVVLLLVVVFLTWTAGLLGDPRNLSRWELAWAYGAAVAAAFVLTDANRTSLHHFYRERLSSAFLVRRTEAGAPEPVDYKEPLRFSQSEPPVGPRLVSCAVANVSDLAVVPADRDCTSFVFSHDRIGLTDELLPKEATVDSATYEFAADSRYRDATIPAAMAISGAAISPLAGRENRRIAPYRLVLALANARLGVWLPNPLWIDKTAIGLRLERLQRPGPASRWWRIADWVRELFTKPNAFLVGREAFGRTSVLDRFLYVTDGGHYDNLGLIEALRDQPERVVVLDASSDPEDSFRTLGRAIATARMDLGCEIDFNPRDMRKADGKRAATAWGHGTITYRKRAGSETALTGHLWVAKVVMLDDLPWDLEAYQAINSQFPRTSTGNQLYGEFDLEAYRLLGYEVTRRFAPELADVERAENGILIGGDERSDIVVVDYDPSWPARFQVEWSKITAALGTEAISIEHIGSTAVPGLAAKPIIDLLVTVADVEDETRYLSALQRAGYVLRVRERGHRMVRTPELDVHVHLLPHGGPAAIAHMAFRNRLRSSTADRDLYAATKRLLAQQDWPTMNHYADAKTDVILQILSHTNP